MADKEQSIVVESTKEGLRVFDNPVGVLTNNPTFDYQLFNLNNYRVLSTRTPKNNFSDQIELDIYSRGMGGIGLPGDLSSVSRFVKATFTKLNSVSRSSEYESISQFFHILSSVEQQKDCVMLVMKNMSIRFILHVVTWKREFITIVRMTIVKLLLWI